MPDSFLNWRLKLLFFDTSTIAPSKICLHLSPKLLELTYSKHHSFPPAMPWGGGGNTCLDPYPMDLIVGFRFYFFINRKAVKSSAWCCGNYACNNYPFQASCVSDRWMATRHLCFSGRISFQREKKEDFRSKIMNFTDSNILTKYPTDIHVMICFCDWLISICTRSMGVLLVSFLFLLFY